MRTPGRNLKKAWNVKSLPDKPGMMMPTMMKNLTTGKVKAFYVFGENLANTEPDIHHVEHELQSAEFLVCQDIFPTETTRFAHVILPAAAWSENDGTFYQFRAARQPRAHGQCAAGRCQTQLVDIQRNCQAVGTRMDIQQRSGNLGQRSIRAGAFHGGNQIRPSGK